MKLLVSRILANIATKMSPRLYIRLSYLHNRKKFPNLRNPRNLSEIVLSSIDNNKVKDYTVYVDKIAVRDEIKKWGYSKYLPEIYFIWNSLDEIDFDRLPQAFVLKTNHGCGSHYVCRDKLEMDVKVAKQTIKSALKKEYGGIEAQYRGIVPKIYCEEYLNDGGGKLPVDYKFICTDGEVKCILLVSDRTTSSYKLATFDTKWEKLDFVTPEYQTNSIIERPKNFDTMLQIARKISEKFDFVRVDLYDLGDRVILGELTFTPQGGIMSYFTLDGLKKMGRY